MAAAKKYTHLFFDLDNTIWDFEENSKHAMKFAFEKFGEQCMHVEFDLFFAQYSKHNRMLWEAYRNRQMAKKELIYKRFQNVFDELNITGIGAEQMNDVYLAEMPNQKALIEGFPDILDYLQKKSYRMYIITNGFREVQHAKLENSELINYFRKVFISEDVKAPKPGPEIFEYAIKSSNAKKSKSLMIGDDWEVDILGAGNFGIDSVYFDGKTGNDIDIQVLENNIRVYKIGQMDQLKQIL